MTDNDKKKDAGKKSYKDTLNLPHTSFDMRAGLLQKEPAMQAKWRSDDLYGQIRAARQTAPRFSLHDGPPYANGNIHMGTSLNKILKDMVIRMKTMAGMDAPYIPGWDCHGLPIEAKVMEELGAKAAEMSAMDIRRRCHVYADKFAKLQSDQFKRLGVMGEFDRPYITMDPAYEASVLELFARLVERGLVYRQLKPVHWSIENRTALADAELEYHDREDQSIYVAFEVVEGAENIPHGDADKVGLLIWTTTPWTLPANEAVAISPGSEYACVHAELDGVKWTLVIARDRAEAVTALLAEDERVANVSQVGCIPGRALVNTRTSYRHPLHSHKACPVVEADYVTMEDGTGLVHTAPGHGIEDYGTGLKNSLPIYCPVQADGTFDETAPEWLRDVSVWKANDKVVDYLSKAGTLACSRKIVHSYPHDWRSKTPTIFRATEQWFISVDNPLAGSKDSLRSMAMEACRRDADDGGVEFVPAWGRKRLAGMLESRPDWCISRQRFWGLPIPVFYNEAGQGLLTPTSVRTIADFVRKEGSDAWFTFPPAQILAGYDPADDDDLDNPEDFPLDSLTPGADIFDVWFESGASWSAVALARDLAKDIPVDLYLEGSDQHRGWFQLSLLEGLGARGRAPFKTVLTHGFVVTEEGLKMSKSLGNTIDAIKQFEKRGADIIRLWVASQNYQDDIRCSDKLIAQAEDAYRKIRNTLRFCMGACSDYDPAVNATTAAEHSIDLWMRMQLHILIRDVRSACDRYEFHRATRLIYEFCTVQASSIYLSAVKDRLYCESPDAARRRASQTVIHEMLVTLTKLLAPILPHTADEAWDHIPMRSPDEPHSVHLAMLPEYDEAVLRLVEDIRPVNPDMGTFTADELQAGPAYVWDCLLALRQQGLVKLEALRNAGVKNSLDSEAIFRIDSSRDDVAELVETYLKELEDMLGVGHAVVERVDGGGELAVEVEVVDSRDKYSRCERSWKRRPDVGSDDEYPELCARDACVMRELARS